MSGESAKTMRFLMHLEPLQGALEAYGRRNLSDPNEIEDVLQTVVGNAYRDFHLYSEGTNFRAWMFRYLNLEIFNRNRRYERHSHEALHGDVVAEHSWERAVAEGAFDSLHESYDDILQHCDEPLAEAVRGLAPLERSALLLRAVGEFKYREIAEILEIPVGTVMSHLARGRARLRRRLAEHFGDPGTRERNAS